MGIDAGHSHAPRGSPHGRLSHRTHGLLAFTPANEHSAGARGQLVGMWQWAFEEVD